MTDRPMGPPIGGATGARTLRTTRSRPLGTVRACVARVAALLVAGVVIVSCTPDDPPAADTGSDTATPEIWAAVGGAQKDGTEFLDWADGTATPPIIRGPQGGQHVWVSVRMKGMSPKKLRMTVELQLVASARVVKPGAVPIMSTLKPSADFPSGFEFTAITAFVKCPCQVAGRQVRVHLALADLYGQIHETEAMITPTWSGDCSLPPSSSCADQ